MPTTRPSVPAGTLPAVLVRRTRSPTWNGLIVGVCGLLIGRLKTAADPSCRAVRDGRSAGRWYRLATRGTRDVHGSNSPSVWTVGRLHAGAPQEGCVVTGRRGL